MNVYLINSKGKMLFWSGIIIPPDEHNFEHNTLAL